MDVLFDSSDFPLCRLTVGPAPSEQGFAAALAEYELALTRNRSFCVLANATATSQVDLRHVKLVARFGERNHTTLQAYVRALGIVVPSSMVRGALKLAFQIKAPPHPYKIVSNIDEAVAYVTPYLRTLA